MHRMILLTAVALHFAAVQGRAGLSWETTVQEFVASPDQEQVSAVFRFRNSGDESITIRHISASCGCLVPELEKRTYAPGETGAIEAEYHVGTRTGLQINRIFIHEEDLKKPVHSLTFQVMIPEVVKIDPAFVFWNIDEDPTPKTVRIEQMADVSVEYSEVRTNSERLTAEWNVIRENEHYELTITPDNTEKNLLGVVSFSANRPGRSPLVFNILVRIR